MNAGDNGEGRWPTAIGLVKVKTFRLLLEYSLEE